MKTKHLLKRPPLPEEDELHPHSLPLKAHLCDCALSGSIASQEEACPTYNDQDLVERAIAWASRC